MEHYPFIIEPLSDDDGGGFFVTFPDLPGCFADGDTVDEAIESARDAFETWMRAQEDRGVQIPEPNDAKAEGMAALQEMRETIDEQAEKIEELRAETKALKAKKQPATRWASVHQKRKTPDVNPFLYTG